jgi:hypothetical protein
MHLGSPPCSVIRLRSSVPLAPSSPRSTLPAARTLLNLELAADPFNLKLAADPFNLKLAADPRLLLLCDKARLQHTPTQPPGFPDIPSTCCSLQPAAGYSLRMSLVGIYINIDYSLLVSPLATPTPMRMAVAAWWSSTARSDSAVLGLSSGSQSPDGCQCHVLGGHSRGPSLALRRQG